MSDAPTEAPTRTLADLKDLAVATAIVASGIAPNLSTEAMATGRTQRRAPANSSAAPTHRSPSGSEAAPRDRSAGPIPGGICNPAALAAIPATEATTSGFVASCRATPRRPSRTVPWRAKTSTQRMLTVGTITALQIAASATPFCGNSPAASVTPT